MSKLKFKQDGQWTELLLGTTTNPYVLPTASTSTLGGVKVDGSTITIADGVISAEYTDTFIATYDTTTYAEILAAYNAGKQIWCKMDQTIAEGITYHYIVPLTCYKLSISNSFEFTYNTNNEISYQSACTLGCSLELDGTTLWYTWAFDGPEYRHAIRFDATSQSDDSYVRFYVYNDQSTAYTSSTIMSIAGYGDRPYIDVEVYEGTSAVTHIYQAKIVKNTSAQTFSLSVYTYGSTSPSTYLLYGTGSTYTFTSDTIAQI